MWGLETPTQWRPTMLPANRNFGRFSQKAAVIFQKETNSVFLTQNDFPFVFLA
jgi:hypothetical protein